MVMSVGPVFSFLVGLGVEWEERGGFEGRWFVRSYLSGKGILGDQGGCAFPITFLLPPLVLVLWRDARKGLVCGRGWPSN